MSHLSIAFWEMVVDIVGLGLCLMTASLLIFRGRRIGRGAGARARGDGTFVEQVLTEVDRQDARMPLTDIGACSTGGCFDGVLHDDRPLERPEDEGGGGGDFDLTRKMADPYTEVFRLSTLGLDVRQIASRVRIPRDEVDLILRCRGNIPGVAGGGFPEAGYAGRFN